MIGDNWFFLELSAFFLPFISFAVLNSKANVKREKRNRQFAMPLLALIYCIVMFVLLDKTTSLASSLFLKGADLLDKINIPVVGDYLRNLYTSKTIYLELVLFNTSTLVSYITFKRAITLVMSKLKVNKGTIAGAVSEIFYNYDEETNSWYIKHHYGQARTFVKTAYYACCFLSAAALYVSCALCKYNLINAPFYPVFAIIIIGEIAFLIDGLEKDEKKSSIAVQADNSRRIAMYPLLRKPLKALFGDKLSAEGTTINNGGVTGGSIEDILVGLERDCGHIGKNYAAFIRKKMAGGLKPNVDYVRCGYDLSTGKSLLFNTPFYDKLNPYVFYAMNRELLTGGKILIVLGRHGTEGDLLQWSEEGMMAVSNIPELWKIEVLSGEKPNEDALPDIGIISRSGVHDLDIHKNNLMFLRKVSFVIVVEPSKLVTTAQIGLNLLIKCCGKERAVTFCSVDRNCDGLVDALSHILMTNITEVSATEYPHGMSSYMYWTADDDYLQHRIVPGVSRFLGMGTEFSMVALKNQVKKAVWYGGEAFPVLDAHWIAKQYYYDLLDYAQLPTTQETFDNCFQASFNMCNERVNDYSYITVEDDRNNLFEIRRNFATIAEQQGFVNVISSEYMLREYMSDNTEIFTADPKAIPYITADYARTKRNAILSLCLLLCIDSVKEEVLLRQMVMLNVDTKEPVSEIWKEICTIFGSNSEDIDKNGASILSVKNKEGRMVSFERDQTILFKRQYSIESGKFESVYTIEDADFSRIILDDLQNASYIAEQESKDEYIGTELKGHVYQKYMPGQFFTLSGKYYEMISTALDNRILVRRASEHIGGRLSYRQVRNYTLNHIEDSPAMGALKSVNNIDIHYQYADFSVDTPGYWRLHAYNDFDNGDLITVNGVPTREYHHKQILKFDFSKFGDAFTDSVRMTLTNLLNEAFITLFADNQAFISAVTPGNYDAPLTYSLALSDSIENADKCIFIIEDSQLDIGLLIAVERNINRIFHIISDYLTWNEEKIAESIRKENEPEEEKTPETFDAYAEEPKPEKKKGIFARIGGWFAGLFKKKKDKTSATDSGADDGLTPKQRKKAEKTAKKEAKKAEKAAKKAEKQAALEEKKNRKQEEKLRKEQEKAAQKEAKAAEQAEKEASEEVTPVAEVSSDESAEEYADEFADEFAEDPVEDPVEEELPEEQTAEEEISAEEPAEEFTEAISEEENAENAEDAEDTEETIQECEEEVSGVE